MNGVLSDLTPDRLIFAIEENLSSWIPILGLTGETKFNDPPGINRSVSPIPMPLFNSIMDSRLKPEDVDATIQLIILDADTRQVPIMWWLGPSSQPEDLGSQLKKYRFPLMMMGLAWQ